MPGVSDDWKVIIGVSAISLRRYMPSPAGLIDIEAKSAPSEVKAPPVQYGAAEGQCPALLRLQRSCRNQCGRPYCNL